MSTRETTEPVLEVGDLCIDVVQRRGSTRLVNGVTLAVGAGEFVGIVGASGAGKSMTAWAILRLLDAPVQMTGGTVMFRQEDLASMSSRELRQIRGGPIGVVVQNPKGSLDPMRTVGDQLTTVQRRHRDVSQAAAEERAVALLSRLGMPQASGVLRAFPHELSGGMAQRVMLAIALANDPELLLADEPTSGLDATLQLEVLQQLRSSVDETGLSVLMVTHELGLVANFCDRVYVMSNGRVVEHGDAVSVFRDPTHQETRRLLEGAAP